uniref:Putative ER lumen protein-retaining receptor C28H8.4 n=1 Tax=Rhizophora mucronata TaxID=61149 RepID=A0A2P2IH56_RHIMU
MDNCWLPWDMDYGLLWFSFQKLSRHSSWQISVIIM